MTTLLGAFATFSAFGVAVAAYLAAGGSFQKAADWWKWHGIQEALGETGKKQKRGLKQANRRPGFVIGPAAAVISLVVLASGVGLLFCFLWLRANVGGSAHGWGWTYPWAVDLFEAEAVALTIVTLAAVIIAAVSSVFPSPESADDKGNPAGLKTSIGPP
ncbi:MAG: hypothetical protein ABSB01_21230 [Streptosporangiaceae bacterium]